MNSLKPETCKTMNTKIKGRDEIKLPQGYQAGGIRAGLKNRDVKDMTLIVSDVPAAVAGVFTTNQVCAAPVKFCREQLKGQTARAIIVNSGNANACTGARGMADTKRMAQVAAESLGMDVATVFVCSTGSIGVPLPMDLIEAGIRTLATSLSPKGGRDAAEGIMTTDNHPKHWTVPVRVDGKDVIVAGIAKGAGMIEPNMATMLSFILTDAVVDAQALQRALTVAVNRGFNRITVDGDQSTNDTVLLMANGVAGNRPLDEHHPDWTAFQEALNEVSLQLALKIVDDGEGAEKLITVRVKGARSDEDADIAARAVANSFLVKTSWAGAYPNWGRIMDCLGYSRARVVEDKVDIWYDDLQAASGGMVADRPPDELRKIILKPRFTITVDLNIGSGEAVVYTCEITEDYVRINVT